MKITLTKTLDNVIYETYIILISVFMEKNWEWFKIGWRILKVVSIPIVIFYFAKNIEILANILEPLDISEITSILTFLVLSWTLIWIWRYTKETQKQNKLQKRQIDHIESKDSAHLIAIKNRLGRPIIKNMGGCPAHIGNLYINYSSSGDEIESQHLRPDIALMPISSDAQQSEKSYKIPFKVADIRGLLANGKNVTASLQVEYIDNLGGGQIHFNYDFQIMDGVFFPVTYDNNLRHGLRSLERYMNNSGY